MKSYGMEEDLASLLLGWLTISYIIFINFVSILICIDKKVILTFGLFCSCIGDLIIAPLEIFPNKWYMTVIGLPFIGIANAFCVLPAIPQFIDYLNTLFNNEKQLKLPISDLSSGLFISFYSLGTFVGPVLGGVVYDSFLIDSSDQAQLTSFQRSSYSMAGLQAIVLIIFIFGGDVYVSKQRRIKQGDSQGISLKEEDEYYGSNQIGVQMFSSTKPNVSYDESS